MAKPGLRELQISIMEHLSKRPDADPKAPPLTGSNILNLVHGTPTEQSFRLSRYQRASQLKLFGEINFMFPAVLSVLKKTEKENLLSEFLMCKPFQSFMLADSGSIFKSFLLDHSLSQRFSFLPELVSFEWTLIEKLNNPLKQTRPKNSQFEFFLNRNTSFIALDKYVFSVWQNRNKYNPQKSPIKKGCQYIALTLCEYGLLIRKISENEIRILTKYFSKQTRHLVRQASLKSAKKISFASERRILEKLIANDILVR